MAYIRGTADYNLGATGPSRFGEGPVGGGADSRSDPSPLDAIRQQTSKIEDLLDTFSDPVKPYVLSYRRDLLREVRCACLLAQLMDFGEEELLLTAV